MRSRRDPALEDLALCQQMTVLQRQTGRVRSVGLYGVMAIWVSQRRRGIGVRIAVGGDGGRMPEVLLSAGILGCVIPAVRATRVDPSAVLSAG